MNKLFLVILVFISGCSSFISEEHRYNKNEQCNMLFDEQEYSDVFYGFENEEIKEFFRHSLKNNIDLIQSKRAIYRESLNRDATLNEQEFNVGSSLGYGLTHSVDSHDTHDSYSISLNFSSEIDLRGQKKLERIIADINMGSSYIDYRELESSLLLMVVDSYYSLYQLSMELEIYKKIFEIKSEELSFYHASHDLGYKTLFDIKLAKQYLDEVDLNISNIEDQIVKLKNDLSLLSGVGIEELGAFNHENSLYDIKTIGYDNIDKIVIKRDDIVRSTFQLCESLASYNMAVLDLYPNITLGASAGSSASDLAKIFTNPLLGLSVGIDLPFLEWDRVTINKKIAKSTYDSLVESHQFNIYSAVVDIKNKELARDAILREIDIINKKQLITSLELEKANVEFELGYTNKMEYMEQVINSYYVSLEESRYKKDLLVAEFDFRNALGQRVVK